LIVEIKATIIDPPYLKMVVSKVAKKNEKYI
jgi:hypothetical protein